MDKFVREFIDIVRNNPDLPVVPLVEGEVCGEDYGRWCASFGTCRVGEIASAFDRCYTDREVFKKDYFYHNDDDLCEWFHYDPFKKEADSTNDAAEKALEEYLETIASSVFKKVILVYIDTPDDLETNPYEETP